MNISREIQAAEGLSDAQVEKLDQLLAEIEEANPSMPPNIYQTKATVVVDSAQGNQSIPGDLFTASQLKELTKLGDKLTTGSEHTKKTTESKIHKIIGDYLEGGSRTRLYSLDVVSGGWMANLSMPGYMDQTAPSHYDTLAEAIEDLHSMYGDIE
jgi:hypothetical protein